MVAVKQDTVDKFIGPVLQSFSRGLLVPLVLTGRGLSRAFRWLQDELRWRATICELNLMSDHYLDDVSITRNDIDFVAYEMLKPLREDRHPAV
jgi:uncharacterized protein YjiS (DUF1127 family)